MADKKIDKASLKMDELLEKVNVMEINIKDLTTESAL